MKVIFTYEILHSSKKNQDFYVVRLALVDNKGEALRKSQPLIWLTKEQYQSLTSSN